MRAIAAVVLGMMSAAEAQAPKLEDQLIGVWRCESPRSGVNIRTTSTFFADGNETLEMVLLSGEPLNVEVFGAGVANWTLKDGILAETPTKFEFTHATQNGRPLALDGIETILSKLPRPEPSTSVPEIEGEVMLLKSADDGRVGSTCTKVRMLGV